MGLEEAGTPLDQSEVIHKRFRVSETIAPTAKNLFMNNPEAHHDPHIAEIVITLLGLQAQFLAYVEPRVQKAYDLVSRVGWWEPKSP